MYVAWLIVMNGSETPQIYKYGESKTTRIMIATLRHVISGGGRTKFQNAWFFLNRVYNPVRLCNSSVAILADKTVVILWFSESCGLIFRPADPSGRAVWRRESELAIFLGLRVRIPQRAWMSVFYECCVLSGTRLCDRPVSSPENLTHCVCVCVSVCVIESDQVQQ